MFYAKNLKKTLIYLLPQNENHFHCIITVTFVLLLIQICSILQNYLNNSD